MDKGTSLTYIENSKGPSIDPWGTPQVTRSESEIRWFLKHQYYWVFLTKCGQQYQKLFWGPERALHRRFSHIMYEGQGSSASKTPRKAHTLLLNEDPHEVLDRTFVRFPTSPPSIGVPWHHYVFLILNKHSLAYIWQFQAWKHSRNQSFKGTQKAHWGVSCMILQVLNQSRGGRLSPNWIVLL